MKILTISINFTCYCSSKCGAIKFDATLINANKWSKNKCWAAECVENCFNFVAISWRFKLIIYLTKTCLYVRKRTLYTVLKVQTSLIYSSA